MALLCFFCIICTHWTRWKQTQVIGILAVTTYSLQWVHRNEPRPAHYTHLQIMQKSYYLFSWSVWCHAAADFGWLNSQCSGIGFTRRWNKDFFCTSCTRAQPTPLVAEEVESTSGLTLAMVDLSISDSTLHNHPQLYTSSHTASKW